MKKLILLRGLPGSGKSTKAKEIVKASVDVKTYIGSADNFFVDRASGKYEFTPRKIGEAHAWCRGTIDAAMALETDLVIVDNTNTQKWEYESYLQLAEYYGYETEIIVVGKFDKQSTKEYFNRNKHGVPQEAIEKMAARFEK